MTEGYASSEMAAETGLTIDTLRYYERIGLLDPVTRAPNGHRRYDAADVRRVDFLKRLKGTGMPIREMIRYVALFRQGNETVSERRRFLEAHRQLVENQLVELRETLSILDGKIELYRQQERQLKSGENE